MVAFLLLGCAVSGPAILQGGWWHGLHWFAFSCFALAAGYAGVGPRVFGKGADGRIPVWSKVLHLPFLLYSRVVWQLACRFTKENPLDEVTDDLVLGRRLVAAEVPPDIPNYVDLTAEFEDPPNARQLPGYVNFAILDGSIPHPGPLQEVLDVLKPGRTFVHCAQGHGRTGLFAIILLFHRGTVKTYEEGLDLITKARPGVSLNRDQERFVRHYIAADGKNAN